MLDFIKYVVWALMIILQQFSHGISSRAKNSNKIFYNVCAAILSNSVWFFNFYILTINAVERSGDIRYLINMGFFYTLFCVVGSVLSQLVAVHFVERDEKLDWSLKFWQDK